MSLQSLLKLGKAASEALDKHDELILKGIKKWGVKLPIDELQDLFNKRLELKSTYRNIRLRIEETKEREGTYDFLSGPKTKRP